MADDLRTGLSVWAIAAIVCNSVAGVLILILFVVLYQACKVPSCPPEGTLMFIPVLVQKPAKEKYLLAAAP